jgi:hypothetical protein
MADEKKSDDMSEDELDQIIADMSKEEEQAAEEEAAAPVVSIAKAAPAKPAAVKGTSDQSLKMELTGVVNLKLNFASGDRSIELTCTEEALLCRMADGTEFRIPTGMAKKRNAA